jgi:hypothetical protein
VLLRLVKRILDKDRYPLSPRLDHVSPFSSRGSRVESLSATGNLWATLTKKPRKITGRSMGRLPTPCENVSVFDLPDEVPAGPMAMIGVIVGEVTTAQAERGFIIMMLASSADETATALTAIAFCGIGLALFGVGALGEMAVGRWSGGEMPIDAVV